MHSDPARQPGARARRALAAVAAAAATAAVAGVAVSSAQAEPQAEPTSHTDMSLGFYPGWVPYEPEDVDYSAWSHIGHFGVYPESDGGLEFGNLAPEDLTPAVEAAHAADTEIVLVIGSEGYGDEFNEAATDANRSTFVDNIVDLAEEHDYDGVDIDWEEDIHAENFAALISDLRAEIDSRDAELTLSFDAISGLLEPDLAAEVADDVDWIGLMSYWSDGVDELTAYTEAGVDAEKLLIGIGFYKDGYYDTTPEHVQDKIDLALGEDTAGVLVWSFQHLDGDWEDPRLQPLRDYMGESAAN